MPERNTGSDTSRPTRRRFLELLGKGSFVAAFGGIFTTTMRFLMPNVLYEPPTTFAIGEPDDFAPESATFLEDGRLFVFRRPEGLFAISSICTHLGCNVRWNAERGGFDCPCHGSSFDKNGKNIAGPAPSPLKWYELSLNADRQMVVNTRKEVDKNFRLQV